VNKVDTLFPIAFSNSMMNDVWLCEMLWFRKYCQKFRSSDKEPDLIAGGHFAKACEIVRKAYHNDKKDPEEAIELGSNYILEAENTGHVEKTNERVAFALRRYFRSFPLDSSLTPVELADGTFAIEYVFEFDLGIAHPELPETNLTYKGKLDGLYEYRSHGVRDEIVVLDEKTTRKLHRINGTKLVDKTKEELLYKTNGQFIGYHWAARQLGVKTEKSLIRKVPIAATYEPPVELIIPVTPFQIEIWSTTMVNKIEELKDKYIYYKQNGGLPHVAFYPILGNGCNNYDRPCYVSDGCFDKYGEQLIASKYQQLVWDSAKQLEVPLQQFKLERGLK